MPLLNTEPLVRQALVALITSLVPDGRVWNRERTKLGPYRFPNDDEDNPIHGWAVIGGNANGENVERRRPFDTCSYLAYRTYTLRGWFDVDDELDSYSTYRAECALIMNTLSQKDNRDLGGGSGLITDTLPALVTFDYDVREDYLLHFAEIEIETVSEEHTA